MINEPAGTRRRAYGRSLADFEPLLPAEEKLARKAAQGVKCELDMVVPGIATVHNRIRAGFLRFLALGGDKTTPLHELGVWLQGAFVEEAFDLIGANLPANLTLGSCRFDKAIWASGARTRTISFDRSSFATITAYGAQIRGGLSLQGVRANGEVLFLGAHIDGDLECNGGTFENPNGKALFFDRAEIGGGVFLCNDDNQPFQATGEVRFVGAHIGGDFKCTGGRFKNTGGVALNFQGARIRGGVFLCNDDNQPFQATGEVCLVGAQIVGTLICEGAQFKNPGVAINFDSAQIGSSVFLRNSDNQPFQATGEVRLLGAHIVGTLTCIGRFENPGGKALSFDRSRIGGSVFLGRGEDQLFRAIGEVRLPGAHIDGNLVFGGGRFENPEGNALACDNSIVNGSLRLRANVEITGNVSLLHVDVGTLADDPSYWPAGSLALDGFRYARIETGSPSDASERVAWLTYWPAGSLALDGFRYARIDAGSPSAASKRIAWLKKQQERFLKGPEFALYPWTHLAKVLREQGHFREAARIDIAREDQMRGAGQIYWHWRPFHALYGILAGYGYKPGRVVLIAFGVWLGCGVLYFYAAEQGVFGPTNALVFLNADYEHCHPDANDAPKNGKAKIGNWTRCAPAEYTSFSPLAYSLDRVLPVVNLGQADHWEPITPSGWSLGSLARLVSWGEEIFGWVAGLTLAGIVSGIVKRKDGR